MMRSAPTSGDFAVMREHRLVGIEADPALATEVLRRQHRQIGHLPLELLAVVVEALEPRAPTSRRWPRGR